MEIANRTGGNDSRIDGMLTIACIAVIGSRSPSVNALLLRQNSTRGGPLVIASSGRHLAAVGDPDPVGNAWPHTVAVLARPWPLVGEVPNPAKRSMRSVRARPSRRSFPDCSSHPHSRAHVGAVFPPDREDVS